VPHKSKILLFRDDNLYRFGKVSVLNADTTHLCNNYSVMRPFVKDNSSP